LEGGTRRQRTERSYPGSVAKGGNLAFQGKRKKTEKKGKKRTRKGGLKCKPGYTRREKSPTGKKKGDAPNETAKLLPEDTFSRDGPEQEKLQRSCV